ncbi:hypothetical protein A9R05_40895 (plasmid) [Burkholderia sp. KK1]|nr:hypothetical protein A9R05_40895 [Burkholderia sp. KK1]
METVLTKVADALSIQCPQFYETTIVDAETELGVFFITVGTRSTSGRSAYHFARDLLGSEWNRARARQIEKEEIAVALGAVVWAAQQIEDGKTPTEPSGDLFTEEHERFALYLESAPVVPFEQSPVAGVSLAHLAKVSGTAIGAFVGLNAASGAWLLITVPAGMIICAAAAGAGHGLEELIRERFRTTFKTGRSQVRAAPKEKKAPPDADA